MHINYTSYSTALLLSMRESYGAALNKLSNVDNYAVQPNTLTWKIQAVRRNLSATMRELFYRLDGELLPSGD